jgi:hypothetical protein
MGQRDGGIHFSDPLPRDDLAESVNAILGIRAILLARGVWNALRDTGPLFGEKPRLSKGGPSRPCC